MPTDPNTIPTLGGGNGSLGTGDTMNPLTQVGGNASSNPNVIQGGLTFGNGGAGMFQGLGGDPASAYANLGSNYQNAYNSALSLNQQNYNNILGGYQQTMQNQNVAQQGVTQGYGDLGNKVQGLIAGTDASQLQANRDLYTANMGNMQQSATSRGLGNTTVTDALARGINLDYSKANTNTENQFAQLQAGYASNIGLAGLGYQGQAVRDNTQLAGNQLNWMNSVNSPYPDVGAYGALAQQFGAAQQSNANRAQNQQYLDLLKSTAGQVPRIGGGTGGGGGGSPFQPTPGLFSGNGGVGAFPGGSGNYNPALAGGNRGPVSIPTGQGGAPGGGYGLGGIGSPQPAGTNPLQSVLGGAGIQGQAAQGALVNGYTPAQLQQFSRANAVQNGGHYLDANGQPQYDAQAASQQNALAAVTGFGAAQGNAANGLNGYSAQDLQNWSYQNAAENGGYYLDQNGQPQYDIGLDPANQNSYADMNAGQGYDYSNAADNGGYYLDQSGQWQYDLMSDPANQDYGGYQPSWYDQSYYDNSGGGNDQFAYSEDFAPSNDYFAYSEDF